MGTREYVGAGGLHVHLDDPLSPEMAKQVARGHLVPVAVADTEASESPEPGTPESDPEQQVLGVKRPAANAKVDDWRAYAVHLGMDPEQAKTATKTDCQDYAAVPEGASTEGQE